MQSSQLIFLVMIIGVFYFLVIRPQQKRVKTQRDMLASLSPGDEIVTIGGIFATVISVDDRIRVALADGTQMEVSRQAIAQALPPRADTDEGEGADVADDEHAADEAQVPAEDATEQ